jgi:hypothetical protein
MHECLVPITAWIGNVFDSIRKTDKISSRVRAVDMQNLLLLLPFLLHNLLEEEVEGYNSRRIFDLIVDPSDECIGILLLIDWYILYHRRYPPKDEVDLQDLQSLSLRYLLIVLLGCTARHAVLGIHRTQAGRRGSKLGRGQRAEAP